METLGMFQLTEANPPAYRSSPFVIEGDLVKAPVLIEGGSRWSKVERKKRKSITDRVGSDVISLQLDFTLDNFDEGRGVELERVFRQLEELYGVDSDIGSLLILESNPPALMPYGRHRNPEKRWFIEKLTYDQDSIVYNDYGNRIRGDGQLILTEESKDTLLAKLSAVQKNKKKKASGGAKKKRYTVKKGDTLSKIAARKDIYGDSSKWRKIADAQTPKIRDPKRVKVGQVLIIP